MIIEYIWSEQPLISKKYDTEKSYHNNFIYYTHTLQEWNAKELARIEQAKKDKKILQYKIIDNNDIAIIIDNIKKIAGYRENAILKVLHKVEKNIDTPTDRDCIRFYDSDGVFFEYDTITNTITN